MSCDDILCLSSCRCCPTCYTPPCVLSSVCVGLPTLHPTIPLSICSLLSERRVFLCLSLCYQTFILLPSNFSFTSLPQHNFSHDVHNTTLVGNLPVSLFPVQGPSPDQPSGLCRCLPGSSWSTRAHPPFSLFLHFCLSSPFLHGIWHPSQQRAHQNP